MREERSNDEAAKAGQDALERSAPERSRDQSSTANPVWQSLALNPSGIQPKLPISREGDPLEREADHIADRVMQAPESKARRNPANAQANSVSPSNVSEAAQPHGQSLDPSTRNFMESRLGHDFSDVKVHTDTRAEEAASAVNARAFTLEHDIVFGDGEYKPSTAEGKRLIAHELGHVVQQSRGEPSSSAMGLGIQREATGAGATTAPLEHIAGGETTAAEPRRHLAGRGRRLFFVCGNGGDRKHEPEENRRHDH